MEKLDTYLKGRIEENIIGLINEKGAEAINYFVKLLFETMMNLERGIFLRKSIEERKEHNKGNGYYKRLVLAMNRYVQIQIPRDRLGIFKPQFLEVIKERDQELLDLSFKLYTKGLTTRDIEDIFQEVYNKKLSRATISQITKEFQSEREAWQHREIDDEYYVIYVDALQVSVRRESVEKEAFYVILGLRKDLRRDILGIYNIPVESSEGWREVFKELKSRGLKRFLFIVSDELSGLSEVIREEFSFAHHQSCIVHKKRNILKYLRNSDKRVISEELKEVFKLGDKDYTYKDACARLEEFLNKWGKKYPRLLNQLSDKNFENYFAYLQMPASIHSMIYTTNWIERLNKSFRRTLRMRNALPSVDSALNLLCAYAIDEERRVYSYPVTAFLKVKEELDKRLEKLRKRYDAKEL